ncbi:hypothetical protein Esti_003505 [Eimeria stiedai]
MPSSDLLTPGSHGHSPGRFWAVGGLLASLAVVFFLYYCHLRLVSSMESTLEQRNLASGGILAEGKRPRKRKRSHKDEEDDGPLENRTTFSVDEAALEGTLGMFPPSKALSSVVSSPSPVSQGVIHQQCDRLQQAESVKDSPYPIDFFMGEIERSSEDEASDFSESMVEFYIQEALEAEEQLMLDPWLFDVGSAPLSSPPPGNSQYLESDSGTQRSGQEDHSPQVPLDASAVFEAKDTIRLNHQALTTAVSGCGSWPRCLCWCTKEENLSAFGELRGSGVADRWSSTACIVVGTGAEVPSSSSGVDEDDAVEGPKVQAGITVPSALPVPPRSTGLEVFSSGFGAAGTHKEHEGTAVNHYVISG